ncbi:MAG: hypothetical protein WBG95_16000 [Sulfitobacter sp.]
MATFPTVFATVATLCLSTASFADTVSAVNGGDTYAAGAHVNQTLQAAGDAFMIGRSVTIDGNSEGDLHVGGVDVSVGANVAEDLYVLGGTVIIRSKIAEDLTAAAFSVRTYDSAVTQGNARLLGNSVTVEGPVEGALSVMARDVILNAPIGGDVRILAQTLSFGPDAVLRGTLTYSTEEQILVPDSVAQSERVVFERISGNNVWEEWDEMGREMPVLPSFMSVLFGFVVSLLFFLLLGALMLGFMPKRLSHLRRSVAAAPGQTLLLGVIGLSMLFGMVPIIALTIIGLPFVPIVLLAIVVFWTLGYALGAYSVAMRIWAVLGGTPEPSSIARLVVFAASIMCVALLNFIPFVGWVVNYTLVLLGIGAMTRALFQSLIGDPDVAFDVDMQPIEN